MVAVGKCVLDLVVVVLVVKEAERRSEKGKKEGGEREGETSSNPIKILSANDLTLYLGVATLNLGVKEGVVAAAAAAAAVINGRLTWVLRRAAARSNAPHSTSNKGEDATAKSAAAKKEAASERKKRKKNGKGKYMSVTRVHLWPHFIIFLFKTTTPPANTARLSLFFLFRLLRLDDSRFP
jgi:hypothetical protein